MSQYLDIIFLVFAIAVIFYRLYNILGTEPEQEKKVILISKDDLKNGKLPLPSEISDKLKNLANLADNIEQSDVCKALSQIPDFNYNDFCSKAAKVFEMILVAFACNDEKTLKMLTGKKLFSNFKKIMDQRKEEGICAETDLIKIEQINIENVEIKDNGIAHIIVKFVSEQINLLKDSNGDIIEGDENFVQKITDVWTFEKDINSVSKTWLLVSTKKN